MYICLLLVRYGYTLAVQVQEVGTIVAAERTTILKPAQPEEPTEPA